MTILIEKEYFYASSKGTDSTDYCRQQHQYTDVTVTFAGGKEVRLPEKEFHYEKAADLKYLHGSIKEVRNEAEDETVVQGAVKREHDAGGKCPGAILPSTCKRWMNSGFRPKQTGYRPRSRT